MPATGLTIGSRWKIDNDNLIALARRADELRYDSIWAGESWGRDAFTVLTMIACHTSRIRLATGIATVFSRSPTLTAQCIASLDVASKGRAVLGLGTSGATVIEDWYGVKYEAPLRRTREYIDIIRMALAGQRVDHEGDIFQLRRFRMSFAPEQERIPIFVAALGPRNIALTGELADGWLPLWVHVDHLAGMKKQVEKAAVSAGRSMNEITVAPQILAYVTRNSGEKAEAQHLLRDHMAYYIGGMGGYHLQLFKRYGYVEETRRITEAWANNERDKAASLVSDDMLDSVSIWGDAEDCRRKLEMYRANGADLPVIGFPHGCRLDAALHTLEALAPDG